MSLLNNSDSNDKIELTIDEFKEIYTTTEILDAIDFNAIVFYLRYKKINAMLGDEQSK